MNSCRMPWNLDIIIFLSIIGFLLLIKWNDEVYAGICLGIAISIVALFVIVKYWPEKEMGTSS